MLLTSFDSNDFHSKHGEMQLLVNKDAACASNITYQFMIIFEKHIHKPCVIGLQYINL